MRIPVNDRLHFNSLFCDAKLGDGRKVACCDIQSPSMLLETLQNHSDGMIASPL